MYDSSSSVGLCSTNSRTSKRGSISHPKTIIHLLTLFYTFTFFASLSCFLETNSHIVTDSQCLNHVTFGSIDTPIVRSHIFKCNVDIYEVKRSQRHLLAVIENNWFTIKHLHYKKGKDWGAVLPPSKVLYHSFRIRVPQLLVIWCACWLFVECNHTIFGKKTKHCKYLVYKYVPKC